MTDDYWQRILRYKKRRLATLSLGVAAWNSWRAKNPAREIDISYADLRGWKLIEVNLSGVDLRGANLSGANLESADLSKSNLENAILFRANLNEADLNKAELIKANLRDAKLNGANLCGAKIAMATLTRAELSGAKLVDAKLYSATLNDAELRGANLNMANLYRAKLIGADLFGANLSEAIFENADLQAADLRGANLSGADLHNANLIGANLRRAVLVKADLRAAKLYRADLSEANLRETNLTNADLTEVSLVDTNLEEADLTGCRVYGISAWDVNLKDAIIMDLVITPPDEPIITVDNLAVAQFIYLLLNNENISDVIDTATKKVVLILGRFTPERKIVLDAIKQELRRFDYLPVLFDFDKPSTRSTLDTITLIARLARFIIADITDPKSILLELESIVPYLPSVPVRPILQAGYEPWGMYDAISCYPWVIELYTYPDVASLLASFEEMIIAPAEEKVKSLILEKLFK